MNDDSSVQHRAKVTTTLDPELLAAVDAYVQAHPGTDRSAVLDDALRLRRARELERAMEAQFDAPDGVDPEERGTWDGIRDAMATGWFRAPEGS
jgi:hypothetical protein